MGGKGGSFSAIMPEVKRQRKEGKKEKYLMDDAGFEPALSLVPLYLLPYIL